MTGYQTSGARRANGRAAAMWVVMAFAALAGFPGAGLPGAFGQCQYEVTAIIEGPPCPPFGDSPPLIGSGLNNLGHVVGRFAACPGCGTNCPDSAFFWSEEAGLTPLPMPDEVLASRAYDINDHGRIVGEAAVSGKGWRGFMYDMNTGEFAFLEPLHNGAVVTSTSVANAINNNGIVAGARIIGKPGQSPMPSNAVIWDTNTGEVVDLGVLNDASTTGKTVNDLAWIAGTAGSLNSLAAFIANTKQVLPLGPIPDGITSNVTAINLQNFAAGNGLTDPQLSLPFSSQAALWHDGQWNLLGLLPDCIGGGATDLNDALQVVGTCSIAPGVQRPFLWQHGEMIDLNSLVPDISGMTSSRAINNNGQILLRLGNTRAVLITPVDVPFADLNFDCKVNEHDLLILLAAFGPQPGAAGSQGESPHPADLNGDGIVNVSDLLIMLGNWNP